MGAAVEWDEGTNMQITPGMKLAIAGVLGVGALVTLAACSSAPKGPDADLTAMRFDDLKPNERKQLSLAEDSVRVLKRDDGSVQGAYDGTRLLKAADTHAYGAPVITTAKDLQGDGIATFNEVRQVVFAFDTDHSDSFSSDEKRAFESAVGVVWTPGTIAG